MVAPAFLLALIIRSTSLLLPQTFFQPDEFYQALEPAHQLVFGYGYLTWEWKDLPEIGSSGISTYITAGRMRSWIWPGVFALVYKGLKTLRLDDTFLITSLPRVIGILVAASTDYATFRLSAKLMGPGSASGALFLSLTSLFNAHLLPRSLSTSPETLLVTLALVYFPLPDYIEPTRIAVGQPPKVSKGDLKEAKTDWQTTRSSIDDTTITYKDAADIDYAVMDRMKPHVQPLQRPIENLALAVFFASLAICIRPTTLPLWFFLATDLCIRTAKTKGPVKMAGVVITGCAVFLSTLAASSAIDYAITGRLVIPMLTFIHQNVFRNISAFYGGTNLSYHLVQSLPIMLFPIWWWWAQGFVACLLPKSVLPNRLHTLDRPPGMRTLARALLFTIAVLSLSPHSEWRFLHPLLPSLLLYALPPLHRSFVPLMPGCYRLVRSIRQYTRISKFPFFLCLFAPLAPWLYLNLAHGKAQVQVMNVLQRGELGHVSSLVALMPCHSTPWSSHLHRDIEGWFLTCEPPLHDNPFDHVTQQEMFYQAPVTYLQSVFPLAPGPLHQSMSVKGLNGAPSHVLLFGELLDRSEKTAKGDITVAQAMTELGYHEVWNGWNGFDFAQDESQRRGGVRVWTR